MEVSESAVFDVLDEPTAVGRAGRVEELARSRGRVAKLMPRHASLLLEPLALDEKSTQLYARVRKPSFLWNQ